MKKGPRSASQAQYAVRTGRSQKSVCNLALVPKRQVTKGVRNLNRQTTSVNIVFTAYWTWLVALEAWYKWWHFWPLESKVGINFSLPKIQLIIIGWKLCLRTVKLALMLSNEFKSIYNSMDVFSAGGQNWCAVSATSGGDLSRLDVAGHFKDVGYRLWSEVPDRSLAGTVPNSTPVLTTEAANLHEFCSFHPYKP